MTAKKTSRKKYANAFVLVYPLAAVQGYAGFTGAEKGISSRGQNQSAYLYNSSLKQTKIAEIRVRSRQDYALFDSRFKFTTNSVLLA